MWRGGGRDLPESPGRELLAEGQQEDVSRRHGSIFSQLAREGRLAVVDSLDARSAEDQAAGRRNSRRWVSNPCWSSPTTVDDNLYLASRNLANVLVVEPRYADPLSLVYYKKMLVTKAAVEQIKEMLA